MLSFWLDEKEIASLKSDLSKNKEKLTRALEYKADREELKDHLRKSKEAIALQREETEQVRKDLDEERQSLKMAQWVLIICVAKHLTYSHSRKSKCFLMKPMKIIYCYCQFSPHWFIMNFISFFTDRLAFWYKKW